MITIIVLLILAGVTIATLTGDNGILNQANNAKNQTEYKSIKEQMQLFYLSMLKEDNMEDLNNIEELTKKIQENFGDDITWSIALDEDTGDIYIKYKNDTIVEHTVSENAPRYNAVIYGLIKNENNSISFEYDVEEPYLLKFSDGTITKGAVLKNTNLGDNVTYEITYTDAIDCITEYNENTGWKLLDYEETNSDEHLYTIKLVSSGCPINFKFNWSESEALWWKPTGSNSVLKATGALADPQIFKNIKLNNELTTNNLSYIKINRNVASDKNEIYCEELISSKYSNNIILATCLTMNELNNARIKYNNNSSIYSESTSKYDVQSMFKIGLDYWLANYYWGNWQMCCCNGVNGNIEASTNSTKGLRVVISINGVKFKYSDAIKCWRLIQ